MRDLALAVSFAIALCEALQTAPRPPLHADQLQWSQGRLQIAPPTPELDLAVYASPSWTGGDQDPAQCTYNAAALILHRMIGASPFAARSESARRVRKLVEAPPIPTGLPEHIQTALRLALSTGDPGQGLSIGRLKDLLSATPGPLRDNDTRSAFAAPPRSPTQPSMALAGGRPQSAGSVLGSPTGPEAVATPTANHAIGRAKSPLSPLWIFLLLGAVPVLLCLVGVAVVSVTGLSGSQSTLEPTLSAPEPTELSPAVPSAEHEPDRALDTSEEPVHEAFTPPPPPPPPPPEASQPGPVLLVSLLSGMVCLSGGGLLGLILLVLLRRRPEPSSAPIAESAPAPSGTTPSRSEGLAFQPFTLGAYRCTGALGEGGMGIVYRASHLKLGRACAVKVLSPSSGLQEAALDLFKREAQMAARISHPNVVTIYDFGEAQRSLFYLAMELVDGVSLHMLPHPLSVERIVELTRQLCEGLDAAHSAGVIHRDLKPSNILLAKDHRGRDLVKILDFGLARPTELSDRSLMEGFIIGTPEWMSPEQARGERNLTARSDIYTLGLIVYSLLTGHKAYADPDNTPLQAVFKRARVTMLPTRPTQLRRSLPAHIDTAIFRALDPKPDNRPASAGEFYARLAL